MEKKISVIMTVYNSEKYLAEAIDSVLNQSFEDFEFIIVDDGSNDNSLDIVKSYNDERIKVLVNDKNSGICFSSNRGISEAKGEYIARIDSDDICHRDRFKRQVEFLDEHTDIFMCATWRNLLFSDGRTVESNIPITKHNEIGFMLLFGNPMITHSTVMFRRNIYENNHYSYERFVQAHDFKLWTQFVIDNNRMEIIPEVLLDYRLNDSGITVTNTKERNKKEADTIKLEYLEGMNLDDKSKNALKKNIEGVPIESFYKEFEDALVNWGELFYQDVMNHDSKGYEAVADILWDILIRQRKYTLELFKGYFKSNFLNRHKLLNTKEGLKFVIKCFLGKNNMQ